MVGTFDGYKFLPESELIQFQRGAHADLVWNDIPPEDGRVIQIGWLRSCDVNTGKPGHRGMPFNQQMSFPRTLTLHATVDGLRVFAKPVREIKELHGKRHFWQDIDLSPNGENPLAGIEGELFHIRVEFELRDASEFGIRVRGMPVRYDVKRQKLCFPDSNATLPPEDGKIRLQLLIDRSSIEVFGNQGQVAYPFGFLPEADDRSLTLYTKAGNTRVSLLEVYELRSIWF
jgi:sucrose-6-phosphate hydrolase SacC (GH32 family)